MRWYSVWGFVLLLNLTLTAMAGFDVFDWRTGGQPIAMNWQGTIVALASAAVATGVVGVFFLHGGTIVGAKLVGVFLSGSGLGLTVNTCRWLELPTPITLIVTGMTGFLALMAVGQIIGGTRYED